MSYQYQGKRVSKYWRVVLLAAQDAGVKFQLNSGQRTLAEQQNLVNRLGVWSPSNRKGAARPNRNAPHIRQGQQHHALDVDTFAQSNGNARLAAWLRSEGIKVMYTVPGEPWHMEVTAAGLRKLYRRYRKSHRFPNPERRWMREYDRLLRQRKNKDRRRVLRREMKKARKKYWGKKQHAKLYSALLVRSR